MRNFGYEEDGHTRSVGDMRLWKRIVRYTSVHGVAFAGAVFISLLVTGATLAQPWLMQIGIDRYITNETLNLAGRVGGLSNTAVWYGAMVIMVFLFSFFQIILLEYIGQSIMHSIRQDLFSHLLRLDLPFFNANPTGRLVTRLTNDIQNMHEMFTSVMVTLFNDCLRLLGILIALFIMNSKLALLMSLFMPIAIITTILFARLARERFRAIRSQLAKINSFLSETLSGITILQIFNRQDYTRDQFEKLNKGYLQRTLSQIRLFGTFMPLTEFMSSAAVALILWYGGREILHQHLTVGELVAFISYMRLFFQPLRELSQKFSIVQSAMASAERIFQLQDTQPVIEEPTHPTQKRDFEGRLDFNGITFGYDAETPVIHDLQLTVKAGKTVAMVGTTGSGKTTLVNLLLRFYTPQQGDICIDGIPVSEISHNHLRNLVGVVLQDTLLLQDSLLSNIVMDTGKTRDDVLEIMRKTGMKRFIDKLPEGLDTQIGDGGQELSTGEKQLLSFARILCRDPRVLILDEATAAIDTESENILEEAITDIFKGRTSLIIAHRLSTIRRADHIVVMKNGRITEQGNHEQLMQKQAHYYELVTMDLSSDIEQNTQKNEK
ncbi:ABC transporter ATP-binding protein [Desulfopila sp. IMCC35008]|uniref:ABC transporter ATP-binding protein n=1 Tax=Desulfopila sp. IMCC35008 TaxID=2653858 RepID=UPI0013D0D106|nr:ABC transporter ATP-binding protein [Desulfopila sp. IMCC35008]